MKQVKLTNNVGTLLFIIDFSQTETIDKSVSDVAVCTLMLCSTGQLMPITI